MAEMQLNETVDGYIRLPYSFLKTPLFPNGGRSLRRSEIMIYGYIHTFSDAEKRCNAPYRRFEEKFNLSHGTVARAIGALKEANFIDQDKSRSVGASYTCTKTTKEKGFIHVDLYLYATKFEIRGESAPRYLTQSELNVLCLILTHCSNPKDDGTFVGSVRGIMRTLNLSKKTVQDAISALLHAGLIYRSKENRGVNGHQRSKYTANEKLLRRMRKRFKKETAPTSSKTSNDQTRAADERTERERYYSELRRTAENRVNFFLNRLNQDDTYKRADRALRALIPQMAQAEIDQRCDDLRALKAEERRLKAQKARRMTDLNIFVADLIPKYRCQQCSDSGILPNGRSCNCYPNRRQKS